LRGWFQSQDWVSAAAMLKPIRFHLSANFAIQDCKSFP